MKTANEYLSETLQVREQLFSSIRTNIERSIQDAVQEGMFYCLVRLDSQVNEEGIQECITLLNEKGFKTKLETLSTVDENYPAPQYLHIDWSKQ